MIVVVAKQPVPGRVKTRLCPPLTCDQAAELAHAFLDETVRKAARVGGAETAIGFAPSEGRLWFAESFPDTRLLEQGEGNLGERLQRLTEAVFQTGAPWVIFIGTDCPGLGSSDLRAAVGLLRGGTDGVIGPTVDGGYYLLGISRPFPELFRDIPWSTTSVFRQTMTQAAEIDLKLHVLRTERDVDTPEDLTWYRERSRAVGAASTHSID